MEKDDKYRKICPVLYMVIPCYNEEKVLPLTSKLFLKKIKELVNAGKISEDSRVMFVNDGSKDNTWNIITNLAFENKYFIGISQSRNRGHQNAVLAGLMEAKYKCDITISIDCDGQDDVEAMNEMLEKYMGGRDSIRCSTKERHRYLFKKIFCGSLL